MQTFRASETGIKRCVPETFTSSTSIMDDLNPYLELALENAEKPRHSFGRNLKTLEVGYKGDTDLVTHVVTKVQEKIIKSC